MSNLVPIQIEAEGWGTVKFLRALPRREDHWGVLACLRGTFWESVVHEVGGEDLSHAMHGYPWPLLRSLGKPPEVMCRKFPPESYCRLYQDKSCHIRHNRCRPGEQCPFCYEPSLEGLQTFEVIHEVATALREGRYILVTRGKTFSL
jgi:hypothetical protein